MAFDSNAFFKDLVAKWVESLDIFKGQNFKLFLLESMAIFFRSLILLIKNIWWLILLDALIFGLPGIIFVILTWFLNQMLLAQFLSNLGLVCFLPLLTLIFFVIFFTILAMRPSLENKNFAYFLSYFKSFFLGFLAIFLLTKFLNGISLSFSLLVLIIVSLFYFDSKGDLKSFFYSFFNAGKMFLNFCPVVLLLFGICALFLYGFEKLGMLFNGFLEINYLSMKIFWGLLFELNIVLFYLFNFFFLSACTMYYIKIKHDADLNLKFTI